MLSSSAYRVKLSDVIEETSLVITCKSHLCQRVMSDSAYRIKFSDVIEETHPVAVVLPRNPCNREAEIFLFKNFIVAIKRGESSMMTCFQPF